MARPATAHKAKKRKAAEAEEDSAGDTGLTQRLAAYGESFLQMFEDHESRAATAAAAQDAADSGSSESDVDVDSGSDDGGSDGDGGGGAAGRPGSNVVEHIFDSRRVQKGGAAAIRGGGFASRQPPPPQHQQQRLVGGGSGPAGGAGGVPRGSSTQQQQQARQEGLQELDRLKLERRRFMSHKAAVITGGGGGGATGAGPEQQVGRRRKPGGKGSGGTPTAAAAGTAAGAAAAGAVAAGVEPEGVSRAEFREMQREVQQYGAAGLDRKSKKAFDAGVLERLGAKAAARPRIPAAMGRGMAKKQAQRDERALQEGIAAGMIQAKGLGKKRRREASKAKGGVDRGLMEDGGAFRPGILRVKPPPGPGTRVASGGRKKKQ